MDQERIYSIPVHCCEKTFRNFEKSSKWSRNLLEKFPEIPTLQAEATFSLGELAWEKLPLLTTVQIRPEIWTYKLKKRFFLFLTGLEHYVSLA